MDRKITTKNLPEFLVKSIKANQRVFTKREVFCSVKDAVQISGSAHAPQFDNFDYAYDMVVDLKSKSVTFPQNGLSPNQTKTVNLHEDEFLVSGDKLQNYASITCNSLTYEKHFGDLKTVSQMLKGAALELVRLRTTRKIAEGSGSIQFEIPKETKRFMDLVPELQRLVRSLYKDTLLGKARVHVFGGEDDYITRKVVGYLEHHGIIVSFKDPAVGKKGASEGLTPADANKLKHFFETEAKSPSIKALVTEDRGTCVLGNGISVIIGSGRKEKEVPVFRNCWTQAEQSKAIQEMIEKAEKKFPEYAGKIFYKCGVMD